MAAKRDTTDPAALVERVLNAVMDGEWAQDDLTARRVGAFLGKTTSVFYHHWGSFEGFLYTVQRLGFNRLHARSMIHMASGDLEAMAEDFVIFGLEHPTLYHLMFQRRYNWDALRKSVTLSDASEGGLAQWHALVRCLDQLGSPDPDGDARLLFAGLHGLVSLASTGRANIGALETTDRDMAIALARRLARRLIPSNP